jgi:hypothetical protein
MILTMTTAWNARLRDYEAQGWGHGNNDQSVLSYGWLLMKFYDRPRDLLTHFSTRYWIQTIVKAIGIW